MSDLLYADNAATTRLSDVALQAMLPYLQGQYGNPSSLYRFAQAGKKALEQARAQVAEVLNAAPNEIYFTSGGTEADNWALLGAAALKSKKGRHIITSAIEHHAVLHTAQYLEKQGYAVTYIQPDEQGLISPAAVQAAIRPDTVLISIMAANNEIGTVQPIAEIGAIARAAGVLFHTDAVQAVGHIPVDVAAWPVDMLSLSGHKFQGPKGCGVLYLRKPLRLPPLIYGGGQERGLRSGTENVAGAVGLAAALQQAAAELPAEMQRLAGLRDRLIKGILQLPKTRLTGPDPFAAGAAERLPGLASFVFELIEGESILLRLDGQNICASSGSACSSASLQPSHVLLSIGLPPEIAHGSLRLSLGRDNTEADIDRLLLAVPQVVQGLRQMSPLWED